MNFGREQRFTGKSYLSLDKEELPKELLLGPKKIIMEDITEAKKILPLSTNAKDTVFTLLPQVSSFFFLKL
jgi:hypothetical protein